MQALKYRISSANPRSTPSTLFLRSSPLLSSSSAAAALAAQLHLPPLPLSSHLSDHPLRVILHRTCRTSPDLRHPRASFRPLLPPSLSVLSSSRRISAQSGSSDMEGHTTTTEESRRCPGVRPDDMDEAYGEGYSTRSSEEGFGGIYGQAVESKDTPSDSDDAGQDYVLHTVKGVDDYDRTQGSPVAQKEKSRHGQGFVSGHHPYAAPQEKTNE